MRANAPEVSRHVRVRLDIGHRGSIISAGNSLAEIGNVIPPPNGADTHPRRKKIEEIPFTQYDCVAFELRDSRSVCDHSIVATCWVWAGNVRPLEVSAEKNRPWRVGIAGQEPLRAPQKQFVCDQEVGSLDVAVLAIETLETTYCAQPVRTDSPGKTRYEIMRQTRTCRLRVKQGLSAAVTVVLNSQATASNGLRVLRSMVGVIRAEPGSHLESETPDPLVL